MRRSHRIKLNPTEEQVEFMLKCAWVARNTWNWALGWVNLLADSGHGFSNVGTLKNEFVRLRTEEDFMPLVGEVQSYAYQYAFTDLGAAISRYFDLKKKGLLDPPPDWKPRKDGKPFGWPRFKARDRHCAFGVANSAMKVSGHSLKISRLDTVINMAEEFRFADYYITGMRISRNNGVWYASIQCDMGRAADGAGLAAAPAPPFGGSDELIGLHVTTGTRFIVLSNGEEVERFSEYPKLARKLARAQRAADIKERAALGAELCLEYCANYQKAVREEERIHRRITDKRREFLHEATTALVKKYRCFAVQRWDTKGMIKKKKDEPRQKRKRANKKMADLSQYELLRQIQYKIEALGGEIIEIPQDVPVSHICHECGAIDDVPLGVIIWQCAECGSLNDREINAAIVTKKVAEGWHFGV